MILTILSLVVGYLTLSICIALLFTTGAATGQAINGQFLAFASVCSLGFATLSGWLTALVAQRAPIFHSGLLAVLLSIVWAISTFASASTDSSTAEPLSVAVLNLAVGVTGVMMGGWLRLRQMKARDAAESEA